jgi:MoxR-like ATPase
MPFDLCRSLIENVSRVIVGKGPTIELLVAALLAEGHVLIEDLPGLGKTLIAKTLARSIGAT